MGQGAGRDSEKLLLTAVANCLSASPISLREFKNDAVPMRQLPSHSWCAKNMGGREGASIQVEIRLGCLAGGLRQFNRTLAQFEDFCVVTQCVRTAIPVGIRVLDRDGVVLAG